jgi:penicillin G amidase
MMELVERTKMKTKTKKILLSIFGLLVIVIVIFMVYANTVIRGSLPITNGEITLQGVQNPVEITFDKMGIPQVWTQNEKDAWFAVGWLHANDRLFQMELTRRVSQGRLSEMFGDITLDFDRSQRRIGHARMAKSELDKLEINERILLQSYSDGINTWAKSAENLPFEYLLLGLEYEEWKIEDCMAILSFQTWFSDALQNNDELFMAVYEKYGAEKARELFLNYPDWGKITVPQPDEIMSSIDSNSDKVNIFKKSILENLFASTTNPPTMTHSSNCWSVSPERSESGHAIFASDPHLDITRLPQFWYYIGIHAKETDLNVIGITTPGLPVVVMGHNGEAAWAFTAGGIDVTDMYHEKVNPENKNQYQVNDSWNDFDIIEELIYSSSSEIPDTIIIKSNNHGPVIHENDSLNIAYTLKWAGFDKSISTAVTAGFNLAKVNSYESFRQHVTNFGALDANWMYADKSGNIGYQLGTPIPIRQNFDHNLPLPGWTDEQNWQGYYSIEKTPHSYNPEKGWLATSNNKPDDANLEYELQGNFAFDRIMRISKLLESKDKYSVSDFQDFQMDFNSEYLLRWKAEAVNILMNLNEKDWTERISAWNGNAESNTTEAALMQYWMFLFRKNTFGDEIGKLQSKIKFNLIEKENLPENSAWFDDVKTKDKVESRNDIAEAAMKNAIKLVGDKKWGELQSVTMAHPLAQVPVLGSLLGLERGPFARGGTAGTLNASFNVLTENGFKAIVGPSWRFIIDFADVDAATVVIPSGQSGHPLSSHFFDFYPLWVKGERWNVPFSKKNVQKSAVSKVILKPGKDN